MSNLPALQGNKKWNTLVSEEFRINITLHNGKVMVGAGRLPRRTNKELQKRTGVEDVISECMIGRKDGLVHMARDDK